MPFQFNCSITYPCQCMVGFGGDFNPKGSLVLQKTHFKTVRTRLFRIQKTCDHLENNTSRGVG